MGQGYTNVALSVITEVGDLVAEVLFIDSYAGDNEGACDGETMPCWTFSSRMDFEAGSNPDYFDIRITTTGTRGDDNGAVRRVNGVKKYSFVNGKYALVK